MFASKWKSELRLRSVTLENNKSYLPRLLHFLSRTLWTYCPPIQRQLLPEFQQGRGIPGNGAFSGLLARKARSLNGATPHLDLITGV